MRIATWNIRTLWATDRPSFWWTRRRAVADTIAAIDADVWGLQEAWRLQRRWLGRRAYGRGWVDCGAGRMANGGNEATPIVVGPRFSVDGAATRWYGPNPEQRGQRLPGASFPRIATITELTDHDTDEKVVVANTHLDEASPERRLRSAEQLAEWVGSNARGRRLVVVGDFNCTLDEPPVTPLLEIGLQPVLGLEHGPTSNGFGDDIHAHQIDHIFVSPNWVLERAWVHRQAGYASDHFPVVAELQ